MKLRIKWLVILLFAINSILVGLQDVQALPFGYSDGTFNGEKTIKSGGGLEWIDTRIFVGLVRADVEALLNPGGVYEDFKFATISEVEGLLTDYGTGFGVGFPSTTAGNRLLFDDLGSLMEGSNEVINGRYATNKKVIQIALFPASPSQGTVFPFSDNKSGNTMGAWANRQMSVAGPTTVPEPQIFIMIGLGFAAIFVFRRKTRASD